MTTAKVIRLWWNRPLNEWVVQADGGEHETFASVRLLKAVGQTSFGEPPNEPRVWLEFYDVSLLRQGNTLHVMDGGL